MIEVEWGLSDWEGVVKEEGEGLGFKFWVEREGGGRGRMWV